eukprot:m.19246 g.19246  ORF g.19246 m.19246 type:complete len:758 (+) comp6522_c0_seq1:69-2342(+)
MATRSVCIILALALCCSSHEHAKNHQYTTQSPTTVKNVAKVHHTFRAGVAHERGVHKETMAINVEAGPHSMRLLTNPHRRLFTRDVKFKVITKKKAQHIPFDKERFHFGAVHGDPNSRAHVTIHKSGGIDGIIVTGDGRKFIMEPAARYPADAHLLPDGHDTVLYNVEDMTEEAFAGLQAPNHCGNEDKFKQKQQNRTLPKRNISIPEPMTQSRVERSSSVPDCRDFSSPKCSCDMALVGDTEFLEGPHAQGDVNEAIQHMVNVVIEADQIFRQTVIGGMTGLGFVIGSAVIYADREAYNHPAPLSKYGDGGGADFLDAVTSGLGYKYRDYCTVQLFTFRDFHEGLLGMAWVGQPGGYGGICDSEFNKAFNTGINFGVVISPFVASLVVAHESAHNWGAEHDDPSIPECAPGGTEGNFVMFAAATDGSKKNNKYFSLCSKRQMSKVILMLRDVCFMELGHRCGDGIIEGDEECESFPNSTHICCTSDCKINTARGYECAPRLGVQNSCCTLDCKFKETSHQCQSKTDCITESFCTGSASTCPVGDVSPDNTPCNCLEGNCTKNPHTNAQTCEGGECLSFICENYFGASQCGLPGDASCELGCKGNGWGNGEECVSTFPYSGFKRPYEVGEGRYLPAGTPCRGYNGICDANGKCRDVNQVDSKKSMAPFSTNWFKAYYKYLIIGVGVTILVAFIVLHIRFDAKKKKEFALRERAHLLEAANQQAELEEMDLLSGEVDTDDYALLHDSLEDIESYPGLD